MLLTSDLSAFVWHLSGLPARPMLLDQAGRLQRLFQEATRHRDAVLPARDLMKVADIEAVIPLAIELEQPRDLRRRHPPYRWVMPPFIHQAQVAVLLVPLTPPPQGARREPEDVGRSIL
jgi:hypothetical protein